ncbi:MAG: hypothetical protein HY306_04360 [Nitrosomonadales bacterium]|nr:hypothetical protein [Nitrosomonadales bacterium]
MINPRTVLLFKNLSDKYPRLLERDFPYVLNRLMQLWATPEFEPYMHDLLISKRGKREGFPLGVLEELVFLNGLHEACKRKGHSLPDVDI